MTAPINVLVVCDLLRSGPKTNVEIAHALDWPSYQVASLMAKLRQRGTVERTLGKRRRATYRIAGA